MSEPDGDQALPPGSFAELVERHTRVLYRIALSVLRRPADAEDAVQEAFLAVCRRGRWQELDDPRAYLAQVVWRIAVRHQRARRQEQELTIDIRSRRPAPDQLAIGNDLDRWLQERIDALPDTLRLPLALAAAGDLRLVEIARLLGLPEGTVRRRIHDARQRLRRALEARTAGSPGEISQGDSPWTRP